MIQHLDFETESEADLEKVGAWAYAAHPSTDIMCFAYGETPDWIELRRPGQFRDLKTISDFIGAGRIIAHSFEFEYAIYHLILHRKYGWPALWDPNLWDCTKARAYACRLPGKLSEVCKALNLPVKKDEAGHKLMLKLSKLPRKEPPTSEELEQLGEYCITDVAAEMGVDNALPNFNVQERKVFCVDLCINRRGVLIDVELAEAAVKMVTPLMDDLHARMNKVTSGVVKKATQIQRLKNFIPSVWRVSPPQKGSIEEELGFDEGGMYFASLDKAAIVGVNMMNDVPPIALEAINIRGKANKSSTSKYTKALFLVETVADNRARGLFQFNKAGTGRWAGKFLQPQNFTHGFKVKEQEEAVRMIKAGDLEAFKEKYGENSVEALSDTLRGVFIAAPGKRFMAPDFNAIEARTLFWQADDQDALDTYRSGGSPYVDMARWIYKNEEIEKLSHPKEYDLGKRVILGAGYQMWWPKFKETCWKQGNLIISDELSKMAIVAYREKYTLVKQLWADTQKAVIAAIKLPGTTQYSSSGKVAWRVEPFQGRVFLTCILPSGRVLRYFNPSVKYVETKYGWRDEISYWGVDSKTKKWCKIHTYGGSLVENATQAIARDLLAYAMVNLEEAGYPIVLHAHDEPVAEVPIADAVIEPMIKIMCALPDWAAGLPVKADGWIGDRYHKE